MFAPTGYMTRLRRVKWRTTEEILFNTKIGHIVVPKDYPVDGPSVFWPASIFMPLGRMWMASVLHDYLNGQRKDLDKKLRDELFRDKLIEDGVDGLALWASYRAVRLKR